MLNNDGYITSASPILPVTNMENQKTRIYGLSTLLFMLCFIDIIFSVYYTATFNGICLLFSLVSIVGLYSTKTYQLPVVFIHMILLFGLMVVKLFILYSSTNLFTFILNFVGLCLTPYSVFINYQLYTLIQEIPDSDLEDVKSGSYVPKSTDMIYY